VFLPERWEAWSEGMLTLARRREGATRSFEETVTSCSERQLSGGEFWLSNVGFWRAP
jgi:hypothetical protein